MRRITAALIVLAALATWLGLMPSTPARAEEVGSKKFTESVILGEIARIALEDAGIEASHRRELGGSRILWDALRTGEIDVYPDYTGTLRFEILSDLRLPDDAALHDALAARGLAMTAPLGFSNGYALAMRRDTAQRLAIGKISDLAAHPDLDIAVGNEFVARADGWRALSKAYGLGSLDVRGIDHDLAYRALAAGQIDLTDAYTTDAEIEAFDLVVLEDDRTFFPRYDAVYVYRSGLPDTAVRALDSLSGSIDEARMRELNRMVRMEGMGETAAARLALGRDNAGADAAPGRWKRIWDRTLEHLALVAIALAGALLVAIPLGVFAARRRKVGGAVMSATGLLQTIPSLALFVILIPVLGIGAAPTIAALFLYSLLPIVRNTHAGLTGISPTLIDSADALGLSRAARLRRIELPLALPTIMAGIKTAAVIAVGLATLGAIIGAGGYGQPILTGIRLNDTGTILEGAIPAAAMALAFEMLFNLVQRRVTPRGLKQAEQGAKQ
ncbi:amino acid ABC transporter permease [Novosphingobium marinum]|uniref:Osmoprotectant transport system permease protein n=1 Tax=Novosphingobium marinum TaxID=1514948 RepID=A0A7Z0BTW6_9SPHN|nr:glycine betaine ABC transporter substrate-binding protein [Novosphingobium marinum]NYH96456.1 osmoprotectant transport system permease protein [Novosphingobium marinum]GGC35384.1 amino acid ABC transporter permease [Novosphingobium marinum]